MLVTQKNGFLLLDDNFRIKISEITAYNIDENSIDEGAIDIDFYIGAKKISRIQDLDDDEIMSETLETIREQIDYIILNSQHKNPEQQQTESAIL